MPFSTFIPLIASGISALTDTFSSLSGNSNANKRENELWERNAAYNSPQAQMERLKSAGLNPNLVYGNGSAVNTAPNQPPVHQWQGTNLKDGINQYFNLKMQQEQLKNVQAQNDLIKSQAEAARAAARNNNSNANSRDNYVNPSIASNTDISRITYALRVKDLQFYDSDKQRQVDFEKQRNLIQSINRSYLTAEKKAALRQISATITKLKADTREVNVRTQLEELHRQMRENGIEPKDPFIVKTFEAILGRSKKGWDAIMETVDSWFK